MEKKRNEVVWPVHLLLQFSRERVWWIEPTSRSAKRWESKREKRGKQLMEEGKTHREAQNINFKWVMIAILGVNIWMINWGEWGLMNRISQFSIVIISNAYGSVFELDTVLKFSSSKELIHIETFQSRVFWLPGKQSQYQALWMLKTLFGCSLKIEC